jgi:putative SOS response-associated peptidase YedK/uncharacterized DUF497 family protein
MPSVDWDPAKARRNLKWHKVTFEAATRVFDDPFALDEIDDREDYGEERSNILGMVEGRLLVITYAAAVSLRSGALEARRRRATCCGMCGRITQKSDPRILSLDVATLIEPLTEPPAPRYNGAPGQEHWVIRQHPKTGARHIDRLWWGLIPYWTKEPAPRHKPINATAERVATAPMFRSAYAKRRCLVPVDNFFEWASVKGRGSRGPRQPYAIALKTAAPFALAGIWESWVHPGTGEIVRTFCIVTTAANATIEALHDRMPVILPPEAYDRWLSAVEPDPRDLLEPFPSDLIALWPVSLLVNKPDHDDASILAHAQPQPDLGL